MERDKNPLALNVIMTEQALGTKGSDIDARAEYAVANAIFRDDEREKFAQAGVPVVTAE